MKLGAWSMRVGLGCVTAVSLALASITGCGSSGGSESGTKRDISKIPDPVERADVLIREANSQIKSKDTSGAARNLSQAHKAVDEIRDPAKQAEILAKIGGAYNRAGKRGDAAKVAERGASAVKKISDVNDKLTKAARLAVVLAQADEAGVAQACCVPSSRISPRSPTSASAPRRSAKSPSPTTRSAKRPK